MSDTKNTTEIDKQEKSRDNVMVMIGGRSFYCPCGCNVFNHPKQDDLALYECNACGERYLGE